MAGKVTSSFKTMIWLTALTLLACTVGVGLLFAQWFSDNLDEIDQLCSNSGQTAFAQPAASTSADFQTNIKLSAEQSQNAATIVSIANKRGFGTRGAILGLMVAYQESRLRNVKYGNRTSVGVFQQQKGWGTFQQRTDPVYATNKFYDALASVPSWQHLSYLDAALKVQRPSKAAYLSRSNYFPGWQTLAEQIVGHGAAQLVVQTASDLTTRVAGLLSPQACSQIQAYLGNQEETVAQQAYAAALAKVGSVYGWKQPRDGAALVSWAYSQAGIKLPSTIAELRKLDSNPTAGITAIWIPADKITSQADSLQPGDIPFWSNGLGNIPFETGLYGGSAIGGLRVATYNVKGASHSGWASASGRIVTSANIIKGHNFTAVGLQELQPQQRTKLMKLLGTSYGIYPSRGNYGYPGAHSDNSIVWDKSQVQFVSAGHLRMPFYFNHSKRDIPVVKLRHIASGQEFYMINTHDPAHHAYGKLRWLAARQHAADVDRLTKMGLPIFFTGDFNGSYVVRHTENVTYQNRRSNLTVCIMTASGALMDAYDAAHKPSPRIGACPMATAHENPGVHNDHIFVSTGVRVSSLNRIDKSASDHDVLYIDAGTPHTTPGSGKSKFGIYIGVKHPGGKVGILNMRSKSLLGALRITATTTVSASGATLNGPPNGTRVDGTTTSPPNCPYTGPPGGKRGDQPGPVRLAKYLNRTFGSYSLGIFNCRTIAGSSTMSLHSEGRAYDAGFNAYNTVESLQGDACFKWTIAHASALGAQEIIWKHQIWSPGRGLHAYGSSDHFSHVHIGLNWDGAEARTSFFTSGGA